MKKTLILLSCCSLLAACNGNEESKSEGYDKYYGTTENDSAAAAAVSATSRQSEVDTNIMNIGTTPTTEADPTQNFAYGEKLISLSDCLACHKVDEKLVGPAYKEVAQKYKFNDKNVDYLAEKIIKGGAGVWGQVPMTPHPDIKKEDAREMAKYILSLNK